MYKILAVANHDSVNLTYLYSDDDVNGVLNQLKGPVWRNGKGQPTSILASCLTKASLVAVTQAANLDDGTLSSFLSSTLDELAEIRSNPIYISKNWVIYIPYNQGGHWTSLEISFDGTDSTIAKYDPLGGPGELLPEMNTVICDVFGSKGYSVPTIKDPPFVDRRQFDIKNGLDLVSCGPIMVSDIDCLINGRNLIKYEEGVAALRLSHIQLYPAIRTHQTQGAAIVKHKPIVFSKKEILLNLSSYFSSLRKSHFELYEGLVMFGVEPDIDIRKLKDYLVSNCSKEATTHPIHKVAGFLLDFNDDCRLIEDHIDTFNLALTTFYKDYDAAQNVFSSKESQVIFNYLNRFKCGRSIDDLLKEIKDKTFITYYTQYSDLFIAFFEAYCSRANGPVLITPETLDRYLCTVSNDELQRYIDDSNNETILVQKNQVGDNVLAICISNRVGSDIFNQLLDECKITYGSSTDDNDEELTVCNYIKGMFTDCKDGLSLLSYAASQGGLCYMESILDVLFEIGFEIDFIDVGAYVFQTLTYTIQSKEMEALKVLLRNYSIDDRSKELLLTVALQCNNSDAVEYLLNPDAKRVKKGP